VRTDVIDEVRPEDLDQYRRELTGYCYRMLGSNFETDDAVQETMVRAWQRIDSLEGRGALKSWLYRIATNICLDMLRSRQRRAQPMDLGPSSTVDAFTGATLPENTWITPIADNRVVPEDGDPAELATMRESIQLAFITALQQLPARQRAVLILREVLRWQASEVAELLDTSVASVNSALQRARGALADHQADQADEADQANQGEQAKASEIDADQRKLLAQYVDAFERYDITSLVSLLREDAIMSMPPYNFWLVGADEIGRWHLGPGIVCQGSRMIATYANGSAAFATYHPDPDGGYSPWSIQVVEVAGDRITALHSFLDTNLFAAFGLPDRLDAQAADDVVEADESEQSR
jgi:RNA polymerase sigma-70 factor (ECF subfamily)